MQEDQLDDMISKLPTESQLASHRVIYSLLGINIVVCCILPNLFYLASMFEIMALLFSVSIASIGVLILYTSLGPGKLWARIVVQCLGIPTLIFCWNICQLNSNFTWKFCFRASLLSILLCVSCSLLIYFISIYSKHRFGNDQLKHQQASTGGIILCTSLVILLLEINSRIFYLEGSLPLTIFGDDSDEPLSAYRTQIMLIMLCLSSIYAVLILITAWCGKTLQRMVLLPVLAFLIVAVFLFYTQLNASQDYYLYLFICILAPLLWLALHVYVLSLAGIHFSRRTNSPAAKTSLK